MYYNIGMIIGLVIAVVGLVIGGWFGVFISILGALFTLHAYRKMQRIRRGGE